MQESYLGQGKHDLKGSEGTISMSHTKPKIDHAPTSQSETIPHSWDIGARTQKGCASTVGDN